MNISEIKSDFQSSPDNQIIDLSDSTKQMAFGEWFEKRSIKLNVCDKPNKSLINKTNIAGRCYGNSQSNALQNEIEYYEGFVKLNGTNIMHGFNVSEGKVQDYTALSNPKEFTDWNGKSPTEYCGVKIEKEFIEKHNGEDLQKNYVNIPPLLEKLFIEETSKLKAHTANNG